MGANSFSTTSRGKSAQAAFDNARNAAIGEHEAEYGAWDGYSGTIAEKSGFRVMTPPAGMEPRRYLEELSNQAYGMPVDPRITGFNPYDDKWGYAGCVDLGDGSFIFFGMASS